MAAPSRKWAASLLRFWFEELKPADWWGGSEKANIHLRRHYESWLIALQGRPCHEFLDDPATALGAVLLFDQVPRNLYSGTAKAFASDPLARQLAYAILERGWDSHYTRPQRQFLGLPLMHSEHMADQLESLRYFTALGQSIAFARDHHAMIARFGRYPHRNIALGRKSTPAEKRAIEAGFSW